MSMKYLIYHKKTKKNLTNVLMIIVVDKIIIYDFKGCFGLFFFKNRLVDQIGNREVKWFEYADRPTILLNQCEPAKLDKN